MFSLLIRHISVQCLKDCDWQYSQLDLGRLEEKFRMTDTLFKEVHYSLGGLINDIGLGRIGLPDIQRPFVWANAKVRDLFDSMYRGCQRLRGAGA